MIVYEYDRHTRKMSIINYRHDNKAYRLFDPTNVMYTISAVYLILLGAVMFALKHSLFMMLIGLAGFALLQLFMRVFFKCSLEVDEKPEMPRPPCVGIEFGRSYSRHRSYMFVTTDKIIIWHGGDLPFGEQPRSWRIVDDGTVNEDVCSAMEYCVTSNTLSDELSGLLGYHVPTPYMSQHDRTRATYVRNKITDVIEKYFAKVPQ